MKKIICCILTIFLLFSLFACSGESNEQVKTSGNENAGLTWSNEAEGISLTVPQGYTLDTQDPQGFIFVYERGKGIPCIMFKSYEYTQDMDSFVAELNTSMNAVYANSSYQNLGLIKNNIGGRAVNVISYTYVVDGYNIEDTRYIFSENNHYYVFTTKEVPDLKHNLSSTLDYMIRNFVITDTVESTDTAS